MTSPHAPQDLATPGDDRALAASRLRFLTAEPVDPARVRHPILASWRRSRDQLVVADRVEPTFVGAPGRDHPLALAAAPVLRELASALAEQPVSIVLTDQRGLVLTRLTGDPALAHTLDEVRLAPGFSYAESSVGTNGIGTALEVGSATHVIGHEHFAERLEGLACAGVPIRHPVTGRTVGVLDLTCWRRDAGVLLLTLAKSTANQIQAALLEETDAPQRLTFSEYLRACHRSAGIVVAVSGPLGMLNDYARAVLAPADQAALLAHATADLAVRRFGSREITLPGGTGVRLRCRLIGEADDPAGMVVHVDERPVDPAARARRGRRAEQLPGLIGAGPVWLRACTEVEEVFLRNEWVAVVGEAGVGKERLLRAVQLRRHPVPRITVLDAVDVAQPGWADELDRSLSSGAASLLLQHVDRLSGPDLRRLTATLQEVRRADPTTVPWVSITLTSGGRTDLTSLLRLFPSTVEVPPLRLHIDDVPALANHFLRKLGDGRSPTISADVLRILARSPWPGNVAQLDEVLRWVHAHRRSGVIEPVDLPPQMQAISHRVLSRIEALERDAIVTALADTRGSKSAAAKVLGISRATVYRRIRMYGIVDPG